MGEEMVEHLYIGLEELGKRWGKTSQELLTFVANPNVSTREKPILLIREVATTTRNGKRTDTHGPIWCAIRPRDIREYLVNPYYKIQEVGLLENGKIEMVRIYPGPKAFYKLKIFVIMSEVTRIEAEGGENSAFYKKVTQDLQTQSPIDSQPQNIPSTREESLILSGQPEQLDQQHPAGGDGAKYTLTGKPAIAEHLGMSESWVRKHLSTMPHKKLTNGRIVACPEELDEWSTKKRTFRKL